MLRPKVRLKITVEDTPNPCAMKFTADRAIGGDRPLSYSTAASAAGDPLAKRLFELRHVCNVMVLNDFCTVNKSPAGRWKTMIPQVKAVLTEHLAGAAGAKRKP